MRDKMGQILLIEDSEHIKAVLVTIIQELGHDVFEASEVDAGLKFAAKNKIELVICDLSLPGGKSGLDFLKEYSSFENSAPVIICSTIQNEKIKQEIFDLGAMDFFPKPIDFPKFQKFISEFFTS